MGNQIHPDHVVRTAIWRDVAAEGDPFLPDRSLCHGYDFFGSVVPNASFPETIWLLFRGDKIPPEFLRLFEKTLSCMANLGPRHPAVHASMSAGAVGTPSASAMVAHLAISAGTHLGARDVFEAASAFLRMPPDGALEALEKRSDETESVDFFTTPSRPPGTDPNATELAGTVRSALRTFADSGSARCRSILASYENFSERNAGHLAMTGAVSAALCDLGFSPEQSEMLYLVVPLFGSAAHCLEQRTNGFQHFPFYRLEKPKTGGGS